ncbi:U11/U12 small nuclear ribonucleoprotein 25 kDa protein-like [Asterias amurensis]|uniref:U11/U12 small nuclear ribonucleoprotein 25 kDa protein-like n=1 Tax=Asterias amurensis TaxID=7602 RepID=UPI003AB1F3B7
MEADPSTTSLPTDVQDRELLEPSVTNTQQLTASDTIITQEDLTHKQAMEIVREGLSDVLDGDPLLSDLPAGVTSEEVALQIALEYGQAMTVCVQKFTGEIMPIVVLQGARVQDLKQAIQRYVTLNEDRKGTQTSISWKYVWRTYSLYIDGEQLDKNNKLKEYGIKNKDIVTFVKRRR